MIKSLNFLNLANGQRRFACSLHKIIKITSLSVVLFIFLSQTGAINVCGQDTEPTPAASPAATPAAAPEPKSTPLEGKVEGAENIHIEPKIQAYRSVKEISRNIADDIYTYNPNAKTFVLYRADDYKTWQNYRLNKNRLEDQMTTLKCNYRIWLSLTITALKPYSDPPQERIFFEDITDKDPCFEDRLVVENTSEFQNFKRVVTVQDEFLRKSAAIERQIEALTKRIDLIDSQILAMRTTPKNKREKNKLLAEKLRLEIEIAKEEMGLKSANVGVNAVKGNVLGSIGKVAGFISPITGLVGTAIDLISYFRTDVAFSGTTVDIKQNATRASITNALQMRYCPGNEGTTSSNNQNSDSKKSKQKQESKMTDEQRKAERIANIAKVKKQCVAVYDPYLFTPDVVFTNKRISNGIVNDAEELPDGRKLDKGTLPYGIQWMNDLIKLREKSRVAISGFDFLVAKRKNFETKIAALNTAIAADDAAIKDYTSVLITLIEKSKDNEMSKIAFEKINGLLENAKNARLDKVTALKDAERKLDEIKIPEHLDFVIDNLKVMNASFDKFSDVFTKIDDKSGLSPQMTYERAARLDILFTDYQNTNTAYWLDINALEMEGNTRVRKNLFRYFYYPDISHNGGSIVQFALSDPSGRVLLTNTDDNLRKYQKSSNVAKPVN